MGWSTLNNRNYEHEDTCCGMRGELGAIKFRTLLHIVHHLAEIVLYLHIADVGGGRGSKLRRFAKPQPAASAVLQLTN